MISIHYIQSSWHPGARPFTPLRHTQDVLQDATRVLNCSVNPSAQADGTPTNNSQEEAPGAAAARAATVHADKLADPSAAATAALRELFHLTQATPGDVRSCWLESAQTCEALSILLSVCVQGVNVFQDDDCVTIYLPQSMKCKMQPA